jgi:dihydropyrimidinase
VKTARQGVADLETLMPMLFSEGVVAGRISLDRFVELTSANAARIFGLHPRKGTIAVGSDVGFALWDPGKTMTIDGTRMRSAAACTRALGLCVTMVRTSAPWRWRQKLTER